VIVGVLTALICARVDHKRRGNSYIEVVGDTLLAESSPGFVSVWLALHLDLDETSTVGRVDVVPRDFEQRVQVFQAHEGLAGVEFPLLVPILAPGSLSGSVRNTGDVGSVSSFDWFLDFVDNPKRLSAEAGLDMVQEAKAHAKIVRDGMLQRLSPSRRGRRDN